MKIFSVPIDNVSKTELLQNIKDTLSGTRFFRIATVNPEFLLRAQKDPRFRQVLLDADLRVADGFGIVLAGLLRGEHITRFPGADLMEAVLSIANKKRFSVYLAVRKDGLSSYEEIRVVMLKRYPFLEINGTHIDVKPNFELSVLDQDSQCKIKNSTIVLCNFGAPYQEFFLAGLKNFFGNIRLVMGVGGSFDYLTGKVRRAPRCLRTFGFEWFWRCLQQPKRWHRIWNAVIVFPAKAFLREE